MKTYFLTFCQLLLVVTISFTQTIPGAYIEYKTILPNTNESNLLYQVWITPNYSKVMEVSGDQTTYITDHDKNELTTLYPSINKYNKVDYADSDNHTIPQEVEVDFTSSQKRVIAGFQCQLATVKIATDLMEDEYSEMNIWYTVDLPPFYWANFPFLKNIPGAALRIDVEGNGFVADKLVKQDIDYLHFGIPVFYSNMEDDAYAIEDEYLAEDIKSYFSESEGLYGLRELDDKNITEPIFGYISHFSGDVSIVIDSDHEHYGAINKKGETIMPLQYDYLIYDENKKMYIYAENDKYGLLDREAKVIIPASYEMLSFTDTQLFNFTKEGKQGLIDQNNKIIVPAKYNLISEASENTFIVYEKETYRLHNIQNQKKIAGPYDMIVNANEENLFLTLSKNKYGYINGAGKVVIPFKFTYASPFTDNVAVVLENENYEDFYYINNKGEKVEVVATAEAEEIN